MVFSRLLSVRDLAALPLALAEHLHSSMGAVGMLQYFEIEGVRNHAKVSCTLRPQKGQHIQWLRGHKIFRTFEPEKLTIPLYFPLYCNLILKLAQKKVFSAENAHFV